MKNSTTKLMFRYFIIERILSLSSYSGVIYFYVLIKQDLPVITSPDIDFIDSFFIRNIIYLLIFAVFALTALRLTKATYPPVETLSIKEEKPIESVAVPTYIGFFVIALSLHGFSDEISYAVLIVLFIFWRRLESVFYFNPIWLLFGYRFYEVKSEQGNTFTLITKRAKLKGSNKLADLRRINDYTYLDINK